MADSKIYKQAGNAVSVPVIERIAKKIVKTLDRNPQQEAVIELSKSKNLGKLLIKSYKKLHTTYEYNKENLSNI